MRARRRHRHDRARLARPPVELCVLREDRAVPCPSPRPGRWILGGGGGQERTVAAPRVVQQHVCERKRRSPRETVSHTWCRARSGQGGECRCGGGGGGGGGGGSSVLSQCVGGGITCVVGSECHCRGGEKEKREKRREGERKEGKRKREKEREKERREKEKGRK